MRAVITVIGKDTVGIMAAVTGVCAECNVNVMEVTQSVLQEMFAMILMSDITGCNVSFTEFTKKMTALGKVMGLSVHVMHEDIFNSMHRI